MPIPKTRQELIDDVVSSFTKLSQDLDRGGEQLADMICVDDWSTRDMLAVRVWWTEHVVQWVGAGLRGESPVTPAKGYRWRETPRLNADIIKQSRGVSFPQLRKRLEVGYHSVLDIIARLDDKQLLEQRVFPWAGSYPVSRWLSINTARQYTTARSFVRRVIREKGL